MERKTTIGTTPNFCGSRAWSSNVLDSHSQAIQLANVLAAEVLEQLAAHQLLAKGDQDALFHLLAADRQAIGSRASRAGPKAG
jgi:hypothetical protein